MLTSCSLELSSTYCRRRKHSEFFLDGSCEHAHRFHLFIKIKSDSTNSNRKLPRLSDLSFYKLRYTDSKFFAKTNFVLETLSSSSTWLLVSLHAWGLLCELLASFYSLLYFLLSKYFYYRNEFLKTKTWHCVSKLYKVDALLNLFFPPLKSQAPSWRSYINFMTSSMPHKNICATAQTSHETLRSIVTCVGLWLVPLRVAPSFIHCYIFIDSWKC